MITSRLVDRALKKRTVDDVIAVLGERLGPCVMHNAYLVAHRSPQRRAPLVDHQVRVVHVRQAHGVRAKIDVQKRLLGLDGRKARIVDARTHVLKRRVVWLEHEDACVKVKLEAQVAVHVWDGAEWEGHVEQLIKVATDERVRIEVDHVFYAQAGVKRPEVELGVLVAEAVADAGAVVWWWYPLDLEEFPACCADDAERALGKASWDVEEDTAGGCSGILERVSEVRNGDGVQVVVERTYDSARVEIGCIRCGGRPRGKLRLSVMTQLVSDISHNRIRYVYRGKGRKRGTQQPKGERTAFESHRVVWWIVGGMTCRRGRC